MKQIINRKNKGVYIFVNTLFLYSIFVTFGLPISVILCTQLFSVILGIVITNKGKISISRELLYFIFPIVTVSANTISWNEIVVIKYFVWILLGTLTLFYVVSLDGLNVNGIYKYIKNIMIILAISVLFQLLFSEIFYKYIFPFIKNTDTFYYQYNMKHGIYYGIACDKSMANMIGVIGIGVIFFENWKSINRNYKYLSSILLGFFLISMSGSRTSLLFVPLSIFLVFFFCTVDRKKIYLMSKGIGYVILGILCFIIVAKCFPEITVVKRLLETLDHLRTSENIMLITSGRDRLFGAAIDGIKNNVFFGNGWLQFNSMHIGIIDEGTASYVHNIILQLMHDVGVFGTMLYMIPFLIILVKTLKLIKRISILNCVQFQCTEIYISAYLQIFILLDSFFHVGILDGIILQIYYFAIALFKIGEKKLLVLSGNKYENV